jgi:hypothetical protein
MALVVHHGAVPVDWRGEHPKASLFALSHGSIQATVSTKRAGETITQTIQLHDCAYPTSLITRQLTTTEQQGRCTAHGFKLGESWCVPLSHLKRKSRRVRQRDDAYVSP